MSCGEPHETDCREVLAEVWLLLDNECDHERRELLKRHLDECGPCLEEFGLDEHLKALLARKCGGDHAPDTLKQRLRQSIREIMLRQAVLGAQVTVERGDDGTLVEVQTSIVESQIRLSPER
ncbi:MAG: mycothiol system anti-sigma-R factor [Pseudonocardiaceae bacterium]